MKRTARISVMTLILTISVGIVEAAPLSLPPTSIAQVQTTNGTFTCGLVNSVYAPGTYNASKQTFSSLESQLQQAKRKKRTASGSQLSKIMKVIARLRSQLPIAQSACSAINPNSTAPTPTPPATGATPVPTAAPLGCFDESRNARPGYLGIPSGTTGNFFIGQLIFSRTCSGCHIASDRAGYDFNELTSALPAPTMNLNLGVQERAHLAAYLNYPNC